MAVRTVCRRRRIFAAWVGERVAASPTPIPMPSSTADGRAVGIVTLMEIRPATRVIEVGNILYSPAAAAHAARHRGAIPARALCLRDARLSPLRMEMRLRSTRRRGARRLRYGFTFEGIFRQHMIVKGRNRDTAWFSMLDSEWPARKANFERWLAPENFTADGRQKLSLPR